MSGGANGAGSLGRDRNDYNYSNRQNVYANNQPSNRFEMTLASFRAYLMKTYGNLFFKLCSHDNLLLAFKKAKKRKSKKPYVIEFEKNLGNNLFQLQWELLTHTYAPRQLTTFTVRDPKTRKISASHFRDRVIHHAVCNIIEPIFEKLFIHDSYANRKIKGTLAALKRFEFFLRKVTCNGKRGGGKSKNAVIGYALKADGSVLAAYLFGSVARGEEKFESDIDVVFLAKRGFEPELLMKRFFEKTGLKLVPVVFYSKKDLDKFSNNKEMVKLK